MLKIISFIKNVSGAAAIEFAIVFPVILLLVFGIMELGYVLWADSSMKYAASYASRYAFVNPTASSTAIKNFALSKVDLSGSPITFTVTTNTTTVDIDGSFVHSFLVIPMSPITITTHIHQSVPTNM